MAIQSRKETLLNAVTATTTSNAIGVDGVGKLSLMVYGSAISSGNGVFTVEVSNDPSLGFVPYNRLTSNVTNTNAQNDTRVASATINTVSTGTAILFFPPGDTFNYIRAKVAVTTDGAYTAVLFVS